MMTEETLSLFVYFVCWIVFVYIIYRYKGGLLKNLAYFYVMAWLLMYDFLTPTYGLLNDWLGLFGNDISEYFPKGILLTILSVAFFGIGYLLTPRKETEFLVTNESKKISVTYIRLVLGVSIASVILWAAISGYGIKTLFLVNVFYDTTGGWERDSYYRFNHLKQIFEFSIPALVMAYASSMRRNEFFIWSIVVVIIMLGFGFRYRIIILVFALFICHIYLNGVSKKSTLKIAIVLVIFIGSNVLYGNVRGYVKSISRGIEPAAELSMHGSYEKGPLESVFRYTRNYISNMSLLKHMEENNVEYDFGESMFLHVFIRVLPKSIFDNETKPFPKSLEESAKSWGSMEGLKAGEAFTYVLEFYFSFGIIGVIICSTLFGVVVNKITGNISTEKKLIMSAVTTASLFHYITRGYLPGYLMSYLYMVLPIIL
ncbi:oligosaccharide repeat unit polymerase [Grimontia sp. S25]|uniref:Oligosaccharide repeat unit polymerase n=1 Tax=Grimontia sedimenti TaxID=2711294 RepID=A0A6M1RQA0_9GAMM|nr:O-antigen polymerase [Grimontia sedimenti]NGO00119.1 oligosaccharide repeat unit polymerase [Grimontia sedimenti]